MLTGFHKGGRYQYISPESALFSAVINALGGSMCSGAAKRGTWSSKYKGGSNMAGEIRCGEVSRDVLHEEAGKDD